MRRSDEPLANLQANTRYEVQVQAENSAGAGPWSESLGRARAAARPGAPGRRRPSLVATSATTVEVRWTAPAANRSQPSRATAYSTGWRGQPFLA